MSAPAGLAPLFNPRSVAVIGASPGGDGPANNFIAYLQTYGFGGPIYPVHPSAQSIGGLATYASLSDTPQPVDYLYIAIGAGKVPAVIEGAGGRASVAQVISSGFGETEHGAELQAQLVAAARKSSIRVIGPNSLGTHVPRARLTFVDKAVPVTGPVGVLSQSGGLAADIVRRGQVKGVRFSAVVSAGNCAEVRLCELLDFLVEDANTRVIGLYVENAGEARELFELLKRARAVKPVVLLKGGRTGRGQAAAKSHTGALASDFRLWTALGRQTGTVLVESLDAFVDALLAFQCLQPNGSRPTEHIVLFGNGGGTSVLATDQCVDYGFDIPTLPPDLLERLSGLDLPQGANINNPIDLPANALRHQRGHTAEAILSRVYSSGTAEAIVMHMNMAVLLGYKDDLLGTLLDVAIRVRDSNPQGAHFTLVLRSDGELETEAAKQASRRLALARGIPVFDEPADAARAIACLRTYERFCAARNLSA